MKSLAKVLNYIRSRKLAKEVAASNPRPNASGHVFYTVVLFGLRYRPPVVANSKHLVYDLDVAVQVLDLDEDVQTWGVRIFGYDAGVDVSIPQQEAAEYAIRSWFMDVVSKALTGRSLCGLEEILERGKPPQTTADPD